MKSTEALRVLAEVTAYQWGMVTSAQASMHGVTRLDLSRLAEAGLLERLAHGVYKDAGAPGDEFDDMRAAWLSTDPKRLAYERSKDAPSGVVFAGASAARLHGIGDLWDRHTTSSHQRAARASVPRSATASADLGTRDVTIVEGLPALSLEATIADDGDVVGAGWRGHVPSRRRGGRSVRRCRRHPASGHQLCCLLDGFGTIVVRAQFDDGAAAPVQTTVAPDSPRAAAMPRPAPRVAPATTATRPASSRRPASEVMSSSIRRHGASPTACSESPRHTRPVTPLQRYIAEEIATDHVDGLMSRREAMRRLALIGVGTAAASALIAACGDADKPGDKTPTADAPVTSSGAATAAAPPPGVENTVDTTPITWAGPRGELQAAWARLQRRPRAPCWSCGRTRDSPTGRARWQAASRASGTPDSPSICCPPTAAPRSSPTPPRPPPP